MPLGSDDDLSRSQPQYATFILPRTGERLRGLVSLRRSRPNGPPNEERRGLLTGDLPEHETIRSRARQNALSIWLSARQFASSELGIGVLKCSLAYFLGSLATFIPPIAAFLGRQDGKHVVATVTVYFHPARSQGSMYKALICALLAFLYAASLSVTSMFVAMFFEDTLDMLGVGHAVVLVVFCGGGLGFIAWTKQRLGDPLVNVACSLACLSTITVLTKEGAVQAGDLSFEKVVQVLKMIIMGVTATVAVSFLIFPISARKKLRLNVNIVTETLAAMLAIITESFLAGSEKELRAEEFTSAAARHKEAYARLDGLVKESKLEHFVAGTEKEYRLEKRLVRQVQQITQNLGGLRSAATLQSYLLGQTKSDDPAGYNDDEPEHCHSPSAQQQQIPKPENGRPSEAPDPQKDNPSMSPADVFSLFISHLGPSMRSLAFTLSQALNELPFGPSPNHKIVINHRFGISLRRALDLYRESREQALTSIYRRKEIAKIRTLETEADLEEVSASCGHFSFSLFEFGEQLKELLAILDELQLESEERPNGRSWNWLKFWHRKPEASVPDQVTHPKPSPSLPTGAEKRLGYRIWKSLGIFRRDDTKFAIKVGAGAALYALPSFIPTTRPFYSHWRGEWGLLSYMLVCSMFIGSSNTTGYARFLGTCLGALCAIVAWLLTGGNVYALAILGLLMASWTSFLIIVKGRGPMGRFIMLTYNLSVLYAYSLSQQDVKDGRDEGGDSPVITEIVLHRVVAVLSGCVWGVVITRLIWPISARKELKDSLGLLWFRLSLIWKRDPLTTIAEERTSVAYMSSKERLHMERFLSRIESLRTSGRSEFELKSAFPDAAYNNIIHRTRGMVDAFQAIDLELMKTVTATEGEIALLRYTAQERQQLSARISHLLSVTASSMKLEYPLSDVLPSIEHTRDRLLARIFHYRKDQDESRITTDEDYAMLYAFILVTGQLSHEIMAIMEAMRGIFVSSIETM